MQILNVGSFLQARIVLLNGIPVFGILQKEGEIRVQIEQRPADEGIRFEDVSFVVVAAVIDARGAGTNDPSVGRVHKAEPVEPAGGHFIERDLPGRIEGVEAAVELESDTLMV